ncbi:CRP-like cAMP-binding protein [Bradyrhizobium ottawaense]
MFVSITTDHRSRINSLSELGISSGSNPIVSLSEFTYKKGKTIYIESEPAEYVYQVGKGAVRTCKLLFDGRRQIGAFHLPGDILDSRTAESTDLRRKRSSKPLFA